MTEPGTAASGIVFLAVADHRIIARGATWDHRAALKRVTGGRWSPRASLGGGWTYPATPRTASDLHESLAGIPTDYDEGFLDLLAKADAQRAAAVFKDADDLPPIPGEVMTSWNHQRQAFWFLNELHSGALFAEMGPVAGSAIVTINRGGNSRRMTLAEVHEHLSTQAPGGNRYRGVWDSEIPTYVRGLRHDGRLGLVPLTHSLDKGVQAVVKITLQDGSSVTCTPDHEVIVRGRGKVAADRLDIGDLLEVDTFGDARTPREKIRKLPGGGGYTWLYQPGHPSANDNDQVLEHVAVVEAYIGRRLVAPECIHHRNGIPTDNRLENLVLCANQEEHAKYHDWRKNLPGVLTRAEAVVSVEPAGFTQVYCLHVADEAHTFVADGIVVSNTGKSKVACDLLRNWESQTTLIVSPKRVLGVWPKQFRLHGGQDVHVENGQVLVGRTDPRWEPMQVAKRVRAFEKALDECRCGRPHVIVVNYEATAHDPLSKWALNRTWDAVVLDESHRIRAPKGVWSMWASRIRTKTDRRLALTGTPLGQSPLDAFGQYRFLDPGIFGNSYTAFEHRIGVHGGYENHEVIALRVLPRGRDGEPNRYYDAHTAAWFDERLFSIAYEVSADVLDLPEVREIERTCELPPAARKMYRELDRDLFTDLQAWDAGELQASNVMVKLLRLAQLTGGHLRDDDGIDVEVHTAKADLLTEVLEDIDPEESVVVFCRFVPDLDTVRTIAQRLGRPFAELSGRRSDGLTQDATLRLDHGVTAVQIQAGGTGVDFTKAAIAIDFSVGYSRIDFEQSRKRLHRPGQERPVLFIHLIAEKTVDEDIYTSLADDNFTIESVMKRRLQGGAP
jgi:hypothetical protein